MLRNKLFICLGVLLLTGPLFTTPQRSTFYSANLPVETNLRPARTGNGVPNFNILMGIGSVFINFEKGEFEIKELIQAFPGKGLFAKDQSFQSVFISGKILKASRHHSDTYTFEAQGLNDLYKGTFVLSPLGKGDYMFKSFKMTKLINVPKRKSNTENQPKLSNVILTYSLLNSNEAIRLRREFKRLDFGLSRPIMNGDMSKYPSDPNSFPNNEEEE
ncbi:hypothetical protein HOG98_06945 [bacterium]|jgi:hypothetical protein|nr:hypothetical protein [bacterium]